MRSVLATVIVWIKLISFPYFRDICVTQKQKILQKLQTDNKKYESQSKLSYKNNPSAHETLNYV